MRVKRVKYFLEKIFRKFYFAGASNPACIVGATSLFYGVVEDCEYFIAF